MRSDLKFFPPKLQLRVLDWTMGFFVFAFVLGLTQSYLSDWVPDILRRYGFQAFLVLAMFFLWRAGWRPRWGLSKKALHFSVFVFVIYFGALALLHFSVGLFLAPRPAVYFWPNLGQFVLSALLAPMLEELFFRDLLFRALAPKWSKLWIPIVFSSLLFTIAHFSLYPGAFLLGVISCLFYLRTGGIALSIVFHCISNLSLYFIPALFPNVMALMENFGIFSFFYR